VTEEERELNPHEKASATKRRRTKAKLLLAATEAIEDDGLGMRVEELSTRAGVSTSTVYSFFPTKGAVFREVFLQKVCGPLGHYVDEPEFDEDSRATRARCIKGFVNVVGPPDLIRGMLMDWMETPETEFSQNPVNVLAGYLYESANPPGPSVWSDTLPTTSEAGYQIAYRGLALAILDQLVRQDLTRDETATDLELFKHQEELFLNLYNAIADNPPLMTELEGERSPWRLVDDDDDTASTTEAEGAGSPMS
jgi:AcrR family transcriptional regulator